VAVHDWVRDNIAFGFEGGFAHCTASQTLAARRGFCNTQATLMCALLRAAGIPARPHFVSINAAVLAGLNMRSGSDWLDHSYTEVWLDGRWVATDSYIPDPPLWAAAQALLEAHPDLDMGWGISRAGRNTWDGVTPSFSQFIVAPGAATRLSDHDHGAGAYQDAADFYARAGSARDAAARPRTPVPFTAWGGVAGWAGRFAFAALVAPANAAIADVRSRAAGGGSAAQLK
jgi:hypothetical protein